MRPDRVIAVRPPFRLEVTDLHITVILAALLHFVCLLGFIVLLHQRVNGGVLFNFSERTATDVQLIKITPTVGEGPGGHTGGGGEGTARDLPGQKVPIPAPNPVKTMAPKPAASAILKANNRQVTPITGPEVPVPRKTVILPAAIRGPVALPSTATANVAHRGATSSRRVPGPLSSGSPQAFSNSEGQTGEGNPGGQEGGGGSGGGQGSGQGSGKGSGSGPGDGTSGGGPGGTGSNIQMPRMGQTWQNWTVLSEPYTLDASQQANILSEVSQKPTWKRACELAGHDYEDLLRQPYVPPLFIWSKYSDVAGLEGQQGSVGIRVTITADGKPTDIKITQSSHFPKMDAVAVDTARNTRWLPALRFGTAVDQEIEYSVEFFVR